jgi:hypothetical protein
LLEEEIVSVKAEIQRLDENIKQNEKQFALVKGIKDQLDLSVTIKADTATFRQEIEQLDRDFTVVKSLFKIIPAKLNIDEISYEYVAPCPAACFRITWRPSDGDDIWTCHFQAQEQLFKKFLGRPLTSVTPLYQLRIQSMAEAAPTMNAHPSRIGALLQELNIKLNRLQQTAVELASLKHRYQAKLFIESHTLYFEVTFNSRTCQRQLVATFEVAEAYPFAPVTVEYHGDFDFDKVQSLLKDNATPGFGYLARTCDMLAAHVRCQTESACAYLKSSL